MTTKNDRRALLPLGALAAGFSIAGAAMAQQAEPTPAPKEGEAVLPAVRAKAAAEPNGKNTLRATSTTIGKGEQKLRDIPQTVTVVTERLMDDRNLDEVKAVLRNTAGVSFLAGETGEEDVRLRGFSLQQAGDLYVDGLRDAPLYERDTFNFERIEVLKGSASMLFGRGSTGGVVNQVNKQPFLNTQHEAELTVGSGDKKRVTGDFNWVTGETSALRLNVMGEKTDNWGAKVEKHGIAPSFRWGMGSADEFTLSYYHLQYGNIPNYNQPRLLSEDGRIKLSLPAKNYYGLSSDFNDGSADYGTLTHVHRFGDNSQLKTSLRHGRYERDLWASAIGFAPAANQPGNVAVTSATLSDATKLRRTPKGRVGISDITTLQSDYSGNFDWMGKRHQLLTGVELAYDEGKRNQNVPGSFLPPSPVQTPPLTTVGTPNDGASVNVPAPPFMNNFRATNISAYVQDTMALTQELKLLAGLRFDHFKASYNVQSRVTEGGVTRFEPNSAERSDNLWSPRVGAIFQPNDWSSYYASFGTSYNVSADTYQYAVQGPALDNKDIHTPPEKSRNFEIGGKFDLLDSNLSLGTALFYSEKYNERNTDSDSAATQQLLSGKRHATGLELNLAGRLSPAWDAYLSYTWIPDAKIDESNVPLAANGQGAQVKGDRSPLTPKHSASVWSTYRVLPQLRLGAGLNFRGEQHPERARHVTAPAFTTFDAMAEYTINDNLTAKLYVLNLTDKLYADSLYAGFYAPGAPRTVQLSLKARF
jgi:catecholate siderophore receptor